MFTPTFRLRLICLFFLFVPVLFIGVGQTVFATMEQVVVVEVSPGVDVYTLAADHQAIVLDSLIPLNLYRLQGNDPNLLSLLSADARVISAWADARLEARPSFIDASGDQLAAQPSFIDASGNPEDTPYHQQSAIAQLRLPQAQAISTGAGVMVAVLDSGVEPDHPALNGRLTTGYDFVGEDNEPWEETDGLDSDNDGVADEAWGHGTHVAGIVALVAPQAAIMPVRVFDTDGSGSYFDVAAGILYAVDHGAQVINLSGNGPEAVPFLQTAINYAWEHGVLVAAAAGINRLGYPAAYEHVISVGAVDGNDYRTDFAYFPQEVTVYAPGRSIYSAYHSGHYAWWTGHSMATPFVAGEMALMRAAGQCDHLCVAERLPQAVQPVSDVDGTWRGRIDVYDAVALANGIINANVKVQYRPGYNDTATDQAIQPFFRLINEGNSLALSDLRLRYWYEENNAQTPILDCDYAMMGCAQMTAVFSQVTTLTETYPYLEVGFTAVAGMLYGGGESGEIQLRIHQNNWAVYHEGDDYSYRPANNYVDWDRVTLYYQGQPIWGSEPFALQAGSTTSDALKVQYRTDPGAGNNEVKPYLRLVNEGGTAVPLHELTVRYWFDDGNPQSVTVCDYAQIGCGAILTTLHPTYLEVGFTETAGVLAPGDHSGDMLLRLHKTDWSNYNKTTHHSYHPNVPTTFVDWEQVTLYHNGVLIWGVEP